MADNTRHIETSLEILTLIVNGYKARELLDYAASVEFARDVIAEHHINELYRQADDKNTPEQLAV